MIGRVLLFVSIDLEKFYGVLERLYSKRGEGAETPSERRLKEYSPSEVVRKLDDILSELRAGCRIVVWPVLRREDARCVEELILECVRLRRAPSYLYILASSRHLFDSASNS